MAKKEKNAFVAMAFVLAMMLGTAIAITGGQLAIVQPNTATQDVACGTYSGFLATLATTTGGGQFPSQPGENQVGNGIAAVPGEIYEKTNAFYSWTGSGQSEAIIFEGKIIGCGFVSATISGTRYAFFISTDNGATWQTFKQSDLGGADGNELTYTANSPSGYYPAAGSFTCFPTQSQQWCVNSGSANMPTGIMRIHGVTYLDASNKEQPIIDGAWLKVVVQVQANQWFDMASDIIQLRSAMPAVQWGADLYQVNDTATVRYDVPTVNVNNATAYYLTILNMNTNTALTGYTNLPIGQLHGQASFRVTPDMFQFGGINRLRAVISSQIFNAQMQDTATIDNTQLAPIVNSVTWNKPFYQEGDLVEINISASPNPTTMSPIAKYYVLAHVGGIKYFDEFSLTPTVTFTAANAGVLTVEVTAIDTIGRSSAVGRYSETVGPAVGLCVQYPNAVECTGGPGPDALNLWLGVALLAIGLIIFIAGWHYVAGPIGLMIAILGIVLAGVGTYLLVLYLIKYISFALTPKLIIKMGGGT